MKAVMIGIQPKWCELIASGQKTIEVRKTKPKIDVPFKCYIYCTSIKQANLNDYVDLHRKTKGMIDYWHNKVIGEFVCDKIFTREANTLYLKKAQSDYLDMLTEACLTETQVLDYCGGSYSRDLYFWHISDLKIYDKPKELGELGKLDGKNIIKAFQSWGYCYEHSN